MSDQVESSIPSTFLVPWETLSFTYDKLIDAGFSSPYALNELMWLAGLNYIVNWNQAYYDKKTANPVPPYPDNSDSIEKICLSSRSALARAVFSLEARERIASLDIAAEDKGSRPCSTPIWTSVSIALIQVPNILTKRAQKFLERGPRHSNLIRFMFGLGVVSSPIFGKGESNWELHGVLKEPIQFFNDNKKPSNVIIKEIFSSFLVAIPR